MSTTALTEAVFYILLSLDAPLHGYGIMQNVERLSGGRVRLAAGTLYGALTTLTERGWIEAVGEDEGRRKEYRITPEGRAAVRAELARLQELTANGEALTRDWTRRKGEKDAKTETLRYMDLVPAVRQCAFSALACAAPPARVGARGRRLYLFPL